MTAFVVALVVTLVVMPPTIWAVHRWELIDVPNQRSSHSSPIPRGGGIAIAIGVTIALIVADEWSDALAGVLIGSAVLGAVGLLDDHRDLHALPRLAVQIVTPVVVAVAVTDRAGWELGVAALVAAVGVAGYVNAYNFMDGINGISGLQAAVAGVFLAAVAGHLGDGSLAVAGWALAGASIGFLPFNIVRARVFLGDVGSYFVGFWLGALALLLVDAGAPAVVVVGPFLLYLADTSTVLVRRARRGDPLMEAHREHTYQLLTQAGWSHAVVSALCGAIASLCGLLMLAVIDRSTAAQLLGLAAGLLLVAGYLALPGLLAGRTRRRVAT